MAQWNHANCPQCDSSDAFSFKEGDSFGYCFSCGKSSRIDTGTLVSAKKTQKRVTSMTLDDIQELEIRGFEERKIKKNIAAYYDVRVSYDEAGNIKAHYYPYTRDGKLVAYKRRTLPKKFQTIGDFEDVELFNQSRARGSDRLVITEGEIDAMSVSAAQYEKYGKFFPVVSLTSAAVLKPLIEHRKWARSFKEVVLCFDQDDAGRKATEEAAPATVTVIGSRVK